MGSDSTGMGAQQYIQLAQMAQNQYNQGNKTAGAGGGGGMTPPPMASPTSQGGGTNPQQAPMPGAPSPIQSQFGSGPGMLDPKLMELLAQQRGFGRPGGGPNYEP